MVMGIWNLLVPKSCDSFGIHTWEKVSQVADITTTVRGFLNNHSPVGDGWGNYPPYLKLRST